MPWNIHCFDSAGKVKDARVSSGDEQAALDADWALRSGGSGVVWYHDFSDDAEVDAFRWTSGYSGGNDPNASGTDAELVRRITSDGITGGGCLDYTYPAGSSPNSSYWWRPFAPMNTGSGKAANDPAASDTLTVRSWAATDGGSQLSNFAQGWYGHPDSSDANFDGHEFYLQIRVKMDPRRITRGNDSNQVGKFVWLTTAEGAQSQSNAEHVVWSYGHSGNDGDKNYVRVYALGVNGLNSHDPLDQEEAGSRIQPGSESATDWSYSGGWDTLLINLRPGVQSTTSGDDATRLRIFAAHEGDTSYTRIWDQEYGLGSFEARDGLQALILGGYNNGNDMSQEFYHRFDQVIFSQDFIPCPQSGAMPSWYPSVGEIADVGSSNTQRQAAVADGANSFSGTDSSDILEPYCGCCLAYFNGQPYLIARGGGHSDSGYNGILKFGPLYGPGADTPSWSVFLAASDSGDEVNGEIYSDGLLGASHTYNTLVGAGEEVYMVGSDYYSQSGNSNFNRMVRWTKNGQQLLANRPSSIAQAGAADYFLGRIYSISAQDQFNKLCVYDISTNTWQEEPGSDIAFDDYCVLAIDTNRGRVLAFDSSQQYTGQKYWDAQTLSRSNRSFSTPPNFSYSVQFDPGRDTFVSFQKGTSKTVYELDAQAVEDNSGMTWTSRTFTGDSIVAGEGSTAFYKKELYVPQLKGYIRAASADGAVTFRRSA